jgi:hypothetical protein
MVKIRLLYIITEIILIIALLWAALNLSFFVDDFEAILNLSRLVSSFGIALILVGGITFRKKYPKVVIYGMLFFTFIFYSLEKQGFEKYVESASAKTLQSSFAKVQAMSLVPKGTNLSDRIDFRVGVELMDDAVLLERLNLYIGEDRMLDVIERRVTAEAGGNNLRSKMPIDPMASEDEGVLLRSIEDSYINALHRSKKIYLIASKFKYEPESFEDFVLNYMREVTSTNEEQRAGVLIWLWYLQSEGKVSAQKFRMLRTEFDYSDFRRTRILPGIHKTINSSSVTLKEDSFLPGQGSRYIGESAHMIWLSTTIGVLIAIVSLLANFVVLIRDMKLAKN